MERFHLEIWSDDMLDPETLSQDPPPDFYFPSLSDVKVKAEVYVSHLPRDLLLNILKTTSSQLAIIQVLLLFEPPY